MAKEHLNRKMESEHFQSLDKSLGFSTKELFKMLDTKLCNTLHTVSMPCKVSLSWCDKSSQGLFTLTHE